MLRRPIERTPESGHFGAVKTAARSVAFFLPGIYLDNSYGKYLAVVSPAVG